MTKEQDELIFLLNGVEFYCIPKTVAKCREGALNDNKSVQIIVLPNILKTTPDFKGCTSLKWIFSFRKTDYSELPINSKLYVPSIFIDAKDASNKNIVSFADITKSQSKIKVSTKNVSMFTLENVSINSEEERTPTEETVAFSNLTPENYYLINIKGIYKSSIEGSKEFEVSGGFYVSTLEPILNIIPSKVTNTTIEAKGSYDGDMTVISHGFKNYEEGDKLSLNSLVPGQEVRLTYSITTEDGSIFSISKTILTKDVILDVATTVGSTSCVLKGSYENIDATILESGFKESNSDELKVIGLDPYTSYSRTYYVKTKEGGTVSKSVTFQTKSLELETLQPKGVTNTCSIVSANSNMDDDELTAGFQWRKYDAPSSLKSNEGYATVYDGKLEGYIKNLQTTSYYKVRAFYKSQSGKYYYGNWVTFDPSDFSYFEPTVHTYKSVEIQGSTALLKGVVLQGSDEIIEQGFEYWSGSSNIRQSSADKHVVYANGQRMESEITDLIPNTVYYYRAFARTSKNNIYGETQQFEMPITSSINQVVNSNENRMQILVKNSNGLQVSIAGTEGKCSYKIFSVAGNVVSLGTLPADGEWHNVSETKLPNGIYVIRVYDGKDNVSTKIAVK